MRATANVLIVMSSVLALAIAGCKAPASEVKADIATAGSIVKAVDASPACAWVGAVANDPSAGTICKDILDLLGGALGTIPTFLARKAHAVVVDGGAPDAGAASTAFKELRVNGTLKAVLRPDVAVEYATGLQKAGVSGVVVQ